MGSRRSSCTSNDDFSKDSVDISLEYDDYPLDLVSPVAKDDPDGDLKLDDLDFDLDSFDLENLPMVNTATWPLRKQKAVKRMSSADQENDMVIPDEMITDYGRRSWCDYQDTNDVKQADEQVFISKRNSKILNGHCVQYNQLSNEPPNTEMYAESSIESHYNSKSIIQSCKECCVSVCTPCSREQNPLPDKPTCMDRIKYSVMCPPHGWLSHWLSLALCVLLLWGTLWSVFRDNALPGGEMFAVLVLTVCAYTGGHFVGIVRIPPLIGYILIGFIVRNVQVLNVAKDISLDVKCTIRLFALVILLLKSGLELDPKVIKPTIWRTLRLAAIPFVCEAIVVTVACHFLLELSWKWSILVGILLSAVCQDVVLPIASSLQQKGYGVDESIPALLKTAAIIENVLIIFSFAIAERFSLTKNENTMSILQGPLESLAGLTYGFVLGVICWFVPHSEHINKTIIRNMLLLTSGVLVVLGSRLLNFAAAGPIGCFVIAYTVGLRWRKESNRKMSKDSDNNVLALLWTLTEPLLFSMFGAEIDILNITPRWIGICVCIVLITILVRMLVSANSVVRGGLEFKQKFFVSLTWIPKGTIQVILIQYLLPSNNSTVSQSTQTLDDTTKVIILIAITVLLTVPLGQICSFVSAPRLLHKSKLHLDECRQQISLTEDIVSEQTTTREVTTECETVA